MVKKTASEAKKTPSGSKPKQPKPAQSNADFPAVFARLKAILTPYASGMVVLKNDPIWYYLDTKSIGANRMPIGFGAVRLGKAYVSIYLMPLYMNEELQAQITPALLKRKQGKTCFNFTAVDEPLCAELEAIAKAGFACYQKLGWV